ncbi:MAG TPA: hypothetical protein VJ779_20420 [Acetobacteraceae bacterium]|nr:hypothetical protein [Acetobacteraceae bacterium]
MEYTPERVRDLFASAFVDPALFAARVGGDKQDLEAIRRYLALPIAARPDVAWYFDRVWYCLRFPDIGRGDFDPLTHFLGWGAAEGRSPHPLIDLDHMRDADPALPDGPARVPALLDILDNDRADPSPLFQRDHYRAQLDEPERVVGLLRHFLEHGLAQGLRPAPASIPWPPGGGRGVARPTCATGCATSPCSAPPRGTRSASRRSRARRRRCSSPKPPPCCPAMAAWVSISTCGARRRRSASLWWRITDSP